MMMHMKSAILLILALLSTACSQDVIHLAQLDTGMTRQQVEEVQGKPDEVQSSGKYTALRYGQDYYVILEDDRVIATGSGKITRYPGSDRYFIDESYP